MNELATNLAVPILEIYLADCTHVSVNTDGSITSLFASLATVVSDLAAGTFKQTLSLIFAVSSHRNMGFDRWNGIRCYADLGKPGIFLLPVEIGETISHE